MNTPPDKSQPEWRRLGEIACSRFQEWYMTGHSATAGDMAYELVSYIRQMLASAPSATQRTEGDVEIEILVGHLRNEAEAITCYASTTSEFPPNAAARVMREAADFLEGFKAVPSHVEAQQDEPRSAPTPTGESVHLAAASAPPNVATNNEGRSNAGAESPTVINETAPSAPSPSLPPSTATPRTDEWVKNERPAVLLCQQLERELAEANARAGIFEGGMVIARAVLDERSSTRRATGEITLTEDQWLQITDALDTVLSPACNGFEAVMDRIMAIKADRQERSAPQVPATATSGVGAAEADSPDGGLRSATSVQVPIASPAALSATRPMPVSLKVRDGALWLDWREGIINLSHLVGRDNHYARRDMTKVMESIEASTDGGVSK